MARHINWQGDRDWRLVQASPTEQERRIQSRRDETQRIIAGMGKVKGGPVRRLSKQEIQDLEASLTRPGDSRPHGDKTPT